MITERLILRRWQSSDAEMFHRINSDPVVMRFMPRVLDRGESDALMARFEEHFERHGFGWWALERKDTGELIGCAGLAVPGFESFFTPCVEVGWRLAKEHWGCGYATEAAQAALWFGFTQVGLNEIVSFAVPDNKASLAVMERLRMKRNPEEDFDHPRLPEGHPLRRHVLYRLSKRDWEHSF